MTAGKDKCVCLHACARAERPSLLIPSSALAVTTTQVAATLDAVDRTPLPSDALPPKPPGAVRSWCSVVCFIVDTISAVSRRICDRS